MFNRRNIIASITCFALMPMVGAGAAEADFTNESFAAAQNGGKTILVDVWASWCPTCKAQGPIIKTLLDKPENTDVVMLRVNFDNQKDVLKAFNVRSQSTLIMFKGSKEVARSVGDTSPESIAKLVGAGL